MSVLTEVERVETEWNVEVNVGVLDGSLAAVPTLVYILLELAQGVVQVRRRCRTRSICIDR